MPRDQQDGRVGGPGATDQDLEDFRGIYVLYEEQGVSSKLHLMDIVTFEVDLVVDGVTDGALGDSLVTWEAWDGSDMELHQASFGEAPLPGPSVGGAGLAALALALLAAAAWEVPPRSRSHSSSR